MDGYAVVFHYSGSTLNDNTLLWPQNDADTDNDAGHDFGSAATIDPGTYTGTLYPRTDTDDWYRFSVLAGDAIHASMTPPLDANFDLQLYDFRGGWRATSNATTGATDSIFYIPNTGGEWEIRVYKRQYEPGEGQYSLFLAPPGGPGGGGGCPYVSTWNGSEYVVDNNLIPAAEYSNGTDVTDYYLLQQPLIRADGKYSALIWDLDKHSFLDQAQLIAVDHESDVNVAVSPNGQILTYKNPTPAAIALNRIGISLLDLLEAADNQYYQGYPGDYIQLDFAGADVQDGAKLVLRSDPQCGITLPCLKSPVYVQTVNSSGAWQTVETIYTRLYWSTDIIDLSSYLPDANGELKVRISFTSHDRIDFIGLDTTKEGKFEVKRGNLATANHTRLGDVKELFQNSDNQYAELLPHEQVTVQFTLPQNPEQRRDYIIILEGHYLFS